MGSMIQHQIYKLKLYFCASNNNAWIIDSSESKVHLLTMKYISWYELMIRTLEIFAQRNSHQ
jgi:hypothetical protein